MIRLMISFRPLAWFILALLSVHLFTVLLP